VEPRDLITAIAGKTGDIGAAFYFHPDTLARGKELGLDGFRFYFLGRGGVLGDVEPDVVVSAFGYFSPAVVANVWTSGREVMAPREVAREYLACNAALGRAKLAEVPGLDAYVEAAAAVVAAVDVSGLPLFAGVRSEPVPEDTPGAAIHHGMLLRELRGSVHLVAVVASGLLSKQAHAIKRPGEVEMFGWREPIEIDETHRAALARAEELTNDLLVPAFSVLDEAGAAALVAGTDAIHAALTA
jgi:hypothetical protein